MNSENQINLNFYNEMVKSLNWENKDCLIVSDILYRMGTESIWMSPPFNQIRVAYSSVKAQNNLLIKIIICGHLLDSLLDKGILPYQH